MPPQSVQLPVEILQDILRCAIVTEATTNDHADQQAAQRVQAAINEKLRRMAARDTYHQLIEAQRYGTEADQHSARIAYLTQRQRPSPRDPA